MIAFDDSSATKLPKRNQTRASMSAQRPTAWREADLTREHLAAHRRSAGNYTPITVPTLRVTLASGVASPSQHTALRAVSGSTALHCGGD